MINNKNNYSFFDGNIYQKISEIFQRFGKNYIVKMNKINMLIIWCVQYADMVCKCCNI